MREGSTMNLREVTIMEKLAQSKIISAVNNTKDSQEPQNHSDNNHCINDAFDGARHWNESID